MDARTFLNPGPAYRGVALWMLNDLLEPDEIARQLRGIADAGWGAVITRTFNGLRTPYLGEAWMAILDQIVTHAARLGLGVWFQAGYMPSAVPDLPPALAHRALVRRDAAADLGEGERVLARQGAFAYVERRIDHVVDLLNPAAVCAYLDAAYTQTWLARFGQHFGTTIEAVWVDEPHFQPPLLPWTASLPARFRAAWGYDLVERLPALYGGDAAVRHHYWRIVGEMFREAYFGPVRDWCEAHGVRFTGHLMGEDTLNSQVAWTGSAMPCYAYMHVPGIDHLTKSLTWPSGRKFLLTPLQCASAAHQLGKPLVLSEMYAVSTQGLTFADRVQIAAWLAALGINYRCYHGAFYSLRGRRKRIYPPHLSHQQPWWGENRVVADPFARLSYALQQGVFRPEVLVLHPGESAYCLYDPLAMDRPHDRTNEPQDVQQLDAALVELCDRLLSIQRAFELGDEELLARHGRCRGAELVVGEMAYRAVVLPPALTMRATTLDLLQRFAGAGGALFAAGPLPTRIDGVPDARTAALSAIVTPLPADAGALPSREALRAALGHAAPPDVEVRPRGAGDTSGVWVHSRTLSGGRLIYVHCTDREQGVEGVLRIRGAGCVEQWDLYDGRTRSLPSRAAGGYVEVDLDLAPLGMALLHFREGAGHEGETPPQVRGAARQTREVPVLARPNVTRHDPNALTLDVARYKTERGVWSEPLPVLTIQEILTREGYVGPIALRFAFDVAWAPDQVQLVVEDAAEVEVTVNGAPVHYAGLPHWIDRSFLPIEIGHLVHAGANTVELCRPFHPLPEARFGLARLFQTLEGVELEAVYLTGDFAVVGVPSPGEAQPRCVRLGSRFQIAAERASTTGDLVSNGYPFYAGRVTLSDTVELPAPARAERVVLSLPDIGAAALARVRVNGCDVGAVAWPLYEVEITDQVRGGANEIAVTLTSTLRNLLGPHHRSQGEPDQCWTADYVCAPEWRQDQALLDAHWTDDYVLLRFGLAPGARVRYLSDGGRAGTDREECP
ncbi:MAG: hypothetical protein JXA09_06085 [Anaerolineae bacterium]|nr:hypothetical protein [Anaerolineae bacterium]